MAGRPSKEASLGKHVARKAAAPAQANGHASSQAAGPDLARLAAPDSSATELASEPGHEGPLLAELGTQDRTEVQLGSGSGEADEEDDPWHIPASHEVLLQGRPPLLFWQLCHGPAWGWGQGVLLWAATIVCWLCSKAIRGSSDSLRQVSCAHLNLTSCRSAVCRAASSAVTRLSAHACLCAKHACLPHMLPAKQGLSLHRWTMRRAGATQPALRLLHALSRPHLCCLALPQLSSQASRRVQGTRRQCPASPWTRPARACCPAAETTRCTCTTSAA